MALPNDLNRLGLGGLLGGGLTNQLGAAQSNMRAADLQRAYNDQRAYQQEAIRTAFALDTKLMEQSRLDSADAMRYMLETQIMRHKQEVDRRLAELNNPQYFVQSGTTGKIQIADNSSDTFTWMPKGIRAELQREIDEWLAPVTI